MASRWRNSRFNTAEEEPLGPLANLVDLVLVFACGLIAALIAMSDQLQQHFQTAPTKAVQQVIEQGRELPQLPSQAANGGEGYEAVGQVFRDPTTGKLILIGQ